MEVIQSSRRNNFVPALREPPARRCVGRDVARGKGATKGVKEGGDVCNGWKVVACTARAVSCRSHVSLTNGRREQ